MIIDDGFISEFYQNRYAVITGRLGFGKTRLAFEIAQIFLSRGYRLATNVRSVWSDSLDVLSDEEKIFFLIDEGGWFIRSAKQSFALAAYARKLDFYLLFSGKKVPHSDLADLQIYPFMDLWRNFLIPVTVWGWEYFSSSGKRLYGGFLIQVFPYRLNAVYDTIDPGEPPDRIIEFCLRRARLLFEKYGYSLSLPEFPSQEIDFSSFERALARSSQYLRKR